MSKMILENDSEQIKTLDKEYIAGTYGRFDMAAASGSGAVCVSADGKEYVDFTSGIGVNSLGFCDPDWADAVSAQLRSLQHISNLYYTAPQVKLARELTGRSGMKKVFFCNSGAEANEVAIKCARKYGTVQRGKTDNRIITLKDSFHGRTMATITATGQDHYHEYFTPFVAGFDYCEAGDADQLASLITEDTCAIMIELIQGEGGVNDLSEDFAKAAEALCREHGLLLIVDEVQTGIGRTGTLFAFQQYGIQPDIVTFAKGIGGGLPLGGALFAESCCDVLTGGDHGSTFGGNPAVCAGALVVLSKLDEEGLSAVREKGDYLREKISKMPHVSELTGKGMMIGIGLDGAGDSDAAGDEKGISASDVVKLALENGLLLLTAGKRVRLLPPLTISYDEIDRGLKILESVLASV